MTIKKQKIRTDDPDLPEDEQLENEAKKIQKLQNEFINRELKEEIEEKKREELAKKETSEKEKEELKVKAESIKKLYSLDYWMRCYNRVSYCNQVSGQALFHVALGQALNTFKIYLEDDSEIDWRFHYLWIQDSGSGKGRGMNMVNRVFYHPKFLKIERFDDTKPLAFRKFKSHKLGRTNAAAMINTFEMDKKGNIVIDPNGFEKIKLGVLESNDFIYGEEGRQFLEASSESFEKQEIIMTGCETIGSHNNIYTKQLTNYMEACPTRCSASFALTTRPFGKVKQTLVESGMIQRFTFYPRKLTFEDREEMNKLSSFAFKTRGTKSPFKADFERLIEELNRVVKFAHENFIDFDENRIDDLLSFLHEKMMWFTRNVENEVPNDENRYILQSFVARFKENMVKMAFHSAAMRFSKIVERKDLQYAFDFFKVIFDAQKIWVSLSVEEDKDTKMEDIAMRREIGRILKNDPNGLMTLPELVKEMAKSFNKDYTAMRYHVMKFTKGMHPLIDLEKKPENKRKPGVSLA